MTTLQQAAQQALEALDKLSKLGNGNQDGNSLGNTIAQEAREHLFTALAQPEQRKPLTDEAVGFECRKHFFECRKHFWMHGTRFEDAYMAGFRDAEAAHGIKENT